MYRKDYIIIARAIRETYDEYEDSDEEDNEDVRVAFRQFTSKLASFLKADNYKFDREKFYNASVGN